MAAGLGEPGRTDTRYLLDHPTRAEAPSLARLVFPA